MVFYNPHIAALWTPTHWMHSPWYEEDFPDSEQVPVHCSFPSVCTIAEYWADRAKVQIVWRHSTNIGDPRFNSTEFREWSRDNNMPWPAWGTLWMGISPINDGTIFTFEVDNRNRTRSGLWPVRGPVAYQMREQLPEAWIPLGRGPFAAGYAIRPAALDGSGSRGVSSPRSS